MTMKSYSVVWSCCVEVNKLVALLTWKAVAVDKAMRRRRYICVFWRGCLIGAETGSNTKFRGYSMFEYISLDYHKFA
jgi:hypothetical protein